jgi:hypothetical protein
VSLIGTGTTVSATRIAAPRVIRRPRSSFITQELLGWKSSHLISRGAHQQMMRMQLT